jgi:LPPG:FO 2-phospho-L-lactate transferase
VKVLALCGGIGGAKLALGLAAELPAEDLAIMVNTGDDFSHYGLAISPDIDTVLYTLAGISNRELGWGLEGESWAFMDQLKRLGGADWFNLGDRDLALHVLRSHRLARAESLSAITADMAARLDVKPAILPISSGAAPSRRSARSATTAPPPPGPTLWRLRRSPIPRSKR